ncbi:transposase-like protein [Rhizobium anhuiense]|uniref:hypothetical protein n=1 Tax=Rhizobium sp. MHM7A TaxID=2583233 RepID=UPI0003A9C47F|nr:MULTISPECIES: hypothetical protein [Rhizobium]
MKRFKSARHLQRFVSVHDPIANLFNVPRHDIPSTTIENCEQLPSKHGAKSRHAE